MRLSLKTKFTLATSLLVLAVVTAGFRPVHRAPDPPDAAPGRRPRAFRRRPDFSRLPEFAHRRRRARRRSRLQRPQRICGLTCSGTLDNSNTLNSVMESPIGYSPTIYEITISDRDGIVLVSSDAALRGEKVAQRPPVDAIWCAADFFEQIRTLSGPPQVYEDSLPFKLGSEPFGDIRIGLSSSLIRDEISPGLRSAGYYALGSVLLSTLLAFVVSRASLAPIERISAQLDRISAGEFDLEPVQRGDEFGAVSTKIIGIGKQLRDVREIFSTLRENLDQVMSGLEDGLLAL